MSSGDQGAVFELPDGRNLAYAEYGDPGGTAVFGVHGTPGSRRQILPDDSLMVPAGVRLIVPDRPGYGASSAHAGRTLASFAADLGALAQHLGVGRFGVLGVSGGGPHALACAAAHGARVIAVCLAAGLAPTDRPETSRGMVPANRIITGVARTAPWLLRALMYATTGLLRLGRERSVGLMLGSLPEADRELLTRPEYECAFLVHFRRGDARTARGIADDFALFGGPWGFGLAGIGVPVRIYHGTEDRNVPIAHGRWLAAQLPNATLTELPGGHFAYLERLPELLAAAAGS